MQSEAEAVIAEARAMERQAMDHAETLIPEQEPSLTDLLAALERAADLSQRLEAVFEPGTQQGALVRTIAATTREAIAQVQAAIASKTA